MTRHNILLSFQFWKIQIALFYDITRKKFLLMFVSLWGNEPFFFSLVSFSGMISAFYLCQSRFTCFLSLPILFNMQILIAFLINFRIQWQLRVKARLGKHTNQSNNNSQQPKNLAWRNRHHSRKTVSSIWCSCILNQMWLFLQLKETFFAILYIYDNCIITLMEPDFQTLLCKSIFILM